MGGIYLGMADALWVSGPDNIRVRRFGVRCVNDTGAATRGTSAHTWYREVDLEVGC